MLAKGIVQRAEALGSVRVLHSFPLQPLKAYTVIPAPAVLLVADFSQDKAAITPLYDLLTRFAPDLSYLTPIHPIFVTVSTPFVLAHQPPL
jgi:hypothetical protein